MECMNFLLLASTAVSAPASCHRSVIDLIDLIPEGWRRLVLSTGGEYGMYLASWKSPSVHAASLAIRRHSSGWRGAFRTLSSCLELHMCTSLPVLYT